MSAAHRRVAGAAAQRQPDPGDGSAARHEPAARQLPCSGRAMPPFLEKITPDLWDLVAAEGAGHRPRAGDPGRQPVANRDEEIRFAMQQAAPVFDRRRLARAGHHGHRCWSRTCRVWPPFRRSPPCAWPATVRASVDPKTKATGRQEAGPGAVRAGRAAQARLSRQGRAAGHYRHRFSRLGQAGGREEAAEEHASMSTWPRSPTIRSHRRRCRAIPTRSAMAATAPWPRRSPLPRPSWSWCASAGPIRIRWSRRCSTFAAATSPTP